MIYSRSDALAAFICGFVIAHGGQVIHCGDTWWDWEQDRLGIRGWNLRVPEGFPGLDAMSNALKLSPFAENDLWLL